MRSARLETAASLSAVGAWIAAVIATVVLQIEESPADFCSTTFHHASWKVLAWISLCGAVAAVVLSALTFVVGLRRRHRGFLWGGLAGVFLGVAVFGVAAFTAGITGMCLG